MLQTASWNINYESIILSGYRYLLEVLISKPYLIHKLIYWESDRENNNGNKRYSHPAVSDLNRQIGKLSLKDWFLSFNFSSTPSTWLGSVWWMRVSNPFLDINYNKKILINLFSDKKPPQIAYKFWVAFYWKYSNLFMYFLSKTRKLKKYERKRHNWNKKLIYSLSNRKKMFFYLFMLN